MEESLMIHMLLIEDVKFLALSRTFECFVFAGSYQV
jgi:hypothetical protein